MSMNVERVISFGLFEAMFKNNIGKFFGANYMRLVLSHKVIFLVGKLLFLLL